MSAEQELSENLKKISDEYHEKRIQVVNRNMTGAIAGLMIAMGSVVGMVYSKNANPYLQNPVVQRQIQMTETKSVLEWEKKYSLQKSPPYLTAELEPFLENAFGDKAQRVASLDSAIQIVEKDLKIVEQTPEFGEFASWNNKAVSFSLSAFLVGSCMNIYFMARTDRLRKKCRDEEDNKVGEAVRQYTDTIDKQNQNEN